MIPFAGFSWLFFFLLAVAPTATAGLLVWWVRLALYGQSRDNLRRHGLALGVWMLCLVACAAWCGALLTSIVQMEQESARYEAAHRMELTRPERIGDIDMPIGTRLRLNQQQDPASYLSAEFPHPVDIRGMAVTRIERSVMSDYSETYQTVGNHPTSATLFGDGQARIEGWACDATQGVGFTPARDGRLLGLEKCTLSPGNRAADFEIPAGIELRSIPGGTQYADGQRGDDRWRVTPFDSEVIRIRGVSLAHVDLYLTADRGLERLGQGYLVCSLDMGTMHYAPGTLAMIPARSSYEGRPWIFSPLKEPARRDDGPEVVSGHAVVQGVDGTVLDVLDNEQAGVYRFAEFGVPAPMPACPSKPQ